LEEVVKAKLVTLFAVVALGAVAATALATTEHDHPEPGEVNSEVPALTDFHEVIYPLWHQAWPEEDYEMMKELLPQVREHVKAVRDAELPGILRDKQTEWAEGVKRLEADLAAYEAAAATDDGPVMRTAVEDLHAHFEGLMRLIFPVMKELDAYHRVLYGIYHYDMPEADLEGLRGASKELSAACRSLRDADIPKRFQSKADALGAGFASLCRETEQLEAVAADADWESIEDAVEKVHTQYQEVEGLF
jgi:hypothetical protein